MTGKLDITAALKYKLGKRKVWLMHSRVSSVVGNAPLNSTSRIKKRFVCKEMNNTSRH